MLELASWPEGVVGSTLCNRTWSGCCGLGTPRFPGSITDTDETDLSHNSQKVTRRNTPHGRTRPNNQTLETELMRTAWNQRTVGQPL